MCDPEIYILLGLCVGFVGGYAGIGGGPFLVSFLVLFCGMSQLSAQGNVLTMMLGPMSLMGVMSMYPLVKKQMASITIGVISYCFFSYFGALAAFSIGETNLKLYFAAAVAIIACIQLYPIIFKSNQGEAPEKTHISHFWVLVLGSITGLVGGLFGIGAGVLMIPLLIGPLKMDKDYARALSLAILVPPVSFGAYLKYDMENTVQWNLVLILFFSYFVANYFCAKAGSKASAGTFKVVYSMVLIAIAIAYLV